MTETGRSLTMYTIYSRPEDYPDVNYVVRSCAVTGNGATPGPILCLTESIDVARAAIPYPADICIPRSDSDPATIVESWI